MRKLFQTNIIPHPNIGKCMIEAEKPKRGRPAKYAESEKKEKYAETSQSYYRRHREAYLQRSAEKYRSQIGNQYTYSSKHAKPLSISHLIEILYSELNEYKIQVIATSVDYVVKDNPHVTKLPLHDKGTIKLYKSESDGKRYITMFGVIPQSNDTLGSEEQYFQTCLARIEKIRNLKSIAFSSDLFKYVGYKELLEKFADDNSAIKVYMYS